MRILFVDVTCPKPYSLKTLASEGLGGTEATVLRVANKLRELGHHAVISQHCSPVPADSAALVGGPFGTYRNDAFDAVVLLRDLSKLSQLRFYFKKARLFAWLHDLPGAHEQTYHKAITDNHAEVIAVSNFHKTQVQETLTALTKDVPRVHVIYNPIDDALSRSLVMDPNKLVFFSSPHKGLVQTLEIFKNARNFNPKFRLIVANPGYLAIGSGLVGEQSGVEIIGTLPHWRILDEVATSLCVFYPNSGFPETFGLVLAEANAVGTPVLAHPFGAAPEVLGNTGQLVDCRNPKLVIDKLMSWYNGNRPIVEANPKFRLSTVAQEWVKLLKA